MGAEKLGSRLRRMRSKKAFSAEHVAKAIGVPVSTYREWQYGRAIRGEPYVAISRVFEVSLWELLTGDRGTSAELAHKLEQLEKDIKIIRSEYLKAL